MMIREILPEERPQWLRMRHALWPDCSEERHVVEIEQITKTKGAGVVLVAAEENGVLHGFAEISVRHDHVDGAAAAPVPYLEGWFVESDFRGRGVGRQLLAGAEKWARAAGFFELASDAELANTQSIDAHVSFGFREVSRTVHFIKLLDTRPLS